MPDDLVFRIGEKRKLSRKVYHDSEVAITAVVCSVYGASGDRAVSGLAGVASPASPDTDKEHEVYYLWDTTMVPADDYGFTLRYTTDGGEEVYERGDVALFPVVSVFDAWAARIQSAWLMESIDHGQRQLSLRQVRTAVLAAVEEYSKGNPRHLQETQDLTADVFEYDLPDEWVNLCSQIERLEYPVDDTEQIREWEGISEYEVDEVRGVWRFSAEVPEDDEQARLYYTTPHVVRDATSTLAASDTVPASDVEAVARYAAGLALLMPANAAPRTSQPNIGADLVNMRTKEQEYGARATAMMDAGRKAWPHAKSLSVGDISL